MKLKEIYTYLKSHQVSVTLDTEQHKILLAANDSTLIEGNASYLVPFVSDPLVPRILDKAFQTAWDGWAHTRKLSIGDLDEFIETYKRWYEIEEPERRNRYAALKASMLRKRHPEWNWSNPHVDLGYPI
jgi:hypothetical protein